MFRDINLSNLENVLERNLRADRIWECIFRAFGDTILKMCTLGGNHDGAFVDAIHVPVCLKNLWIRQ